MLRKLEAFREKLKATLHSAGGQTLHPLLRTRLMLHFTHRLDSSTLNVFKAAPTPRPTWVYARARVDGPAAGTAKSNQRSTVAVGATDSKLTAVARDVRVLTQTASSESRSGHPPILVQACGWVLYCREPYRPSEPAEI